MQRTTSPNRGWLSAAFVACAAIAVLGLTFTGCSKDEEQAEGGEESVSAAGVEGGGPIADESGEVILPSSTDPNAGKPPIEANAKKVADAKKPAAKPVKPELKKLDGPPVQIAPPKADPNDIPPPADVAAPPADAEKTQSGLASKVLSAGDGKTYPVAADTVKVHYTGWTTDGKMFDSSVKRGQPAEFPLNGVIAGWTEGLQLMSIGEKRRLWIPEGLAYQGKPGRPQGMLVFDVELLEVKVAPKPPENLKPPADAVKTESGLATKVLTPGKGGDTVADGDTVKIDFTGFFDDGKMFDSSITRGEALTVPVERLFPGWKEGLGLMTVGEKRRLWIPKELGPPMMPGAPEFEYMTIDVELHEIKKPIAAPADVAAPPANAEKTESGMSSVVIQKGTGTVQPKPEQVVKVHYTGWTTDGKMFDSSVMRGEPTEFPLNRVIPGWTEGVGLMVVGEKRRLWIPEEMAYKGRPGAPAGMLVFDVELLEIDPKPAPK